MLCMSSGHTVSSGAETATGAARTRIVSGVRTATAQTGQHKSRPRQRKYETLSGAGNVRGEPRGAIEFPARIVSALNSPERSPTAMLSGVQAVTGEPRMPTARHARVVEARNGQKREDWAATSPTPSSSIQAMSIHTVCSQRASSGPQIYRACCLAPALFTPLGVVE